MTDEARERRRQRRRELKAGQRTRRARKSVTRQPRPVNQTLVDLPPKRTDLPESETVIMACSGPSLDLVDIWAPNVPVCAVSTVIRNRQFFAHRPEYWVLVDRINPNHGPTGHSMGKATDVIKVSPEARRKTYGKWPAWEFAKRHGRTDDKKIPFGAGGKLLCGGNQSSSFACQWLALEAGYSTVIFAGCDFSTDAGKEHCHDRRRKPRERISQAKSLAIVLGMLRAWTVTASEMGITFMSGSPGSPLEDFMETYEWTKTHERSLTS